MRFSCSLLKARKLIGRIPVKYQLTGKSHLTYQVSVYDAWLCFGNRCMSMDVKTIVNMVQDEQNSPFNGLKL